MAIDSEFIVLMRAGCEPGLAYVSDDLPLLDGRALFQAAPEFVHVCI